MISTWVEDRRHLARIGVHAAQIGPLVVVALRTGERQVVRVIGASMLPGDDMLGVKTEFRKALREPAILTLVSGPLADELACRQVH